MKLHIVSASLGLSGAVILYPTAAGHVRLHNFDLPGPDHSLGRQSAHEDLDSRCHAGADRRVRRCRRLSSGSRAWRRRQMRVSQSS